MELTDSARGADCSLEVDGNGDGGVAGDRLGVSAAFGLCSSASRSSLPLSLVRERKNWKRLFSGATTVPAVEDRLGLLMSWMFERKTVFVSPRPQVEV